jgi:hypothetical protein
MKITVRLNGSRVNPWARWGLKQNPFPQIARAEYARAMKQLNSLDGEPITCANDIRERLRGCTDEFIEGCITRFVPGERVLFDVEFPE